MTVLVPDNSAPLCRCKKCDLLKIRKQDKDKPFFTDGKTRRYFDGEGGQWMGLTCPECNRKRSKKNMDKLRDKKLKARKAAKEKKNVSQ